VLVGPGPGEDVDAAAADPLHDAQCRTSPDTRHAPAVAKAGASLAACLATCREHGIFQRGFHFRAAAVSIAAEEAQMRKLSLISIFAVVACGGAHALKDQARDAMPSKDSVAMTTPSSSHASQSSGQYDQSQQNSTVGDASPFFSLTVAVGAVFNVPTAAFLDLLQHV